jgi:predicted phage replisome organizer
MNHGSAPWIQLVTRIFENPKVIAILELPGGEGILICWFRLLCLAGLQNRGGAIYFTDSASFTPEHLAAMWRCKPALVHEALTIFQRLGMIGIDAEGTIWILNWPKYQNPAGLALIRERSLMQLEDRCSARSAARTRELAAARQRKRREKQKQNDTASDPVGDDTSSVSTVTRHAAVTRDMSVTVTPPIDESHRETVTPQKKIENKSVEEPPSVPQGGTNANGHKELSIEDLKAWMNTLFGRQRAWSYEEGRLLTEAAPILKEDRALISWAYKLPRDNEGWALVDGKRASKPKQSVLLLLQAFSSEIDKWRSVRRNGNKAQPKPPKVEDWTDERMRVFREMFPNTPISCPFNLLGEDLQRGIDERVRLREDEIPDEWVVVANQLYGPDISIPRFKKDLAPSVREDIKAALTISKNAA